MIPRLLAYLFGANWKTSAIGLFIALAYGLQQVPTILEGSATWHDFVKMLIAMAFYAWGRVSADSASVPTIAVIDSRVASAGLPGDVPPVDVPAALEQEKAKDGVP